MRYSNPRRRKGCKSSVRNLLVFISLKDEVKSDQSKRQAVLDAALRLQLHQNDCDRRMWEKYDLLRGTLPGEEALALIEEELGDMIAAVELDQTRTAT